MVKEKPTVYSTSQFGAVDRRKLSKTTKNQFKTAKFVSCIQDYSSLKCHQSRGHSLHQSEDNCERIHTVCHVCGWLGLVPVERKMLSKTAKNHLRKLNFCFLYPGLPFFQMPPAIGHSLHQKKITRKNSPSLSACLGLAGTCAIETHPLKCMPKKNFCVRMLNFLTLAPGLPFF